MLTKSGITEKAPAHDVPRTLHLIVHAHIFSFVEGWNESQREEGIFPFQDHTFNFDYLLHLSGINYLIHPDDVSQIIAMMRDASGELIEFNFRFINRTGEIKSLSGLARLVRKI